MQNTAIEIVLVEDNPHDAQLTIRALRKIVNNIVHLQNGQEALDFMFGTGNYTGSN